MKLISVRIKNYKSIEDSNEFTLNPVTCLVGKNESGKTAILQALRKLNPIENDERNYNEIEEYPRRSLTDYEERTRANPTEPKDTVVSTLWELSDSDLKPLAEILGPKCLKSRNARISKGYDNNLLWGLEIDEKQLAEHLLSVSGLSPENAGELAKSDSVAALADRLKLIQAPSAQQQALSGLLQKHFAKGTAAHAAIGVLSPLLPKILYFSQYNIMPGEVAMTELQSRQSNNTLRDSDRTFLALLDLAGTKPDEISNVGKFEQLVAKLEAVSNRISREIFEYWSQNKHLEVQFRFDAARPQDPAPFNSGYVFRTRILNRRHGVTVAFDERSTGFIWFFSFLVWFSQVKKNYGQNLVILLDEPGLSLHARAQADLLRYINEKLKPSYQVVYTTHSPFMVDPENLLSVRTVEDVVKGDEVKGTKVGDKILSTDADTIFPLQAALGYEITQSLFVGKNMLLVEGSSDLMYLQWFSQKLLSINREGLDARWTVSPTGGVDKIASFATLFAGNKLHVAVLADVQEGQKRKIKDLKESELLKKGHVFTPDMYVGQPEADVEDLVGRDLYISLVNACYGLKEQNRIKETKASTTPTRVVKDVEDHFATLPPDIANYDHLRPAVFLMGHGETSFGESSGLASALDRFEKMFKDLNALLPRTSEDETSDTVGIISHRSHD